MHVGIRIKSSAWVCVFVFPVLQTWVEVSLPPDPTKPEADKNLQACR